jgi:two-component system LytT family response regulator
VKALIVDDERLARSELRRLLKAFPEIEVVGEARNAEEAASMVERSAPDLMFLDVQMPGQDGFQLLERLEAVPLVIFTTAYDQYALRAFEVSALDYLLKPIAPERLAAALAKLPRPPRPRDDAQRPLGPGQRIFVRDGDRCYFVALGEIVLLESEGNYTRLHFGSQRPLLLRSLRYLQERLSPEVFFRANRKQMINLRFVEAIHRWPGGGFAVDLRGGFRVAMSRRQAREFEEATRL